MQKENRRRLYGFLIQRRNEKMVEDDKDEGRLAAGCFGAIMAGIFIIGILMFMGTGA